MKIPKKIVTLITTGIIVLNSIPVYAESEDVKLDKIVGNDRYETSVKVSKKLKKVKNIFLVNDKKMIDALTSAPLAKQLDASILYTDGEKIDKKVKDEIIRVNPEKIYLIGGEKAINNKIKLELEELNLKTERIYGKDRYETSLKIAELLNEKINYKKAILVNGENGVADAVSISAKAAEEGIPILLSKDKKISREIESFLNDDKIDQNYIIGGEKAISNNISENINNRKRISGKNRSETNIEIISEFYGNKMKNIYVSKDGMKSNDELVDALTSSVLAAQEKSPIMIVGKDLKSSQDEFISTKKIDNIVQVGGNGNERAIESIKKNQKTEVYDVDTLESLKDVIKKCNANDIINIKFSISSNEKIVLETENKITVNIKGKISNKVEINLPNGSISNLGELKEVDIKSIGEGTFENIGTIESLKIDKNIKNVTVSNNGKIGSIEFDKSNIKLENKGSIDKINGINQSIGGDTGIDQGTGGKYEDIKVSELKVISDKKFIIKLDKERSYSFKAELNEKEVKIIDIRKTKDTSEYTITIDSEMKNNDKLEITIMANGCYDKVYSINVDDNNFENKSDITYRINYRDIEYGGIDRSILEIKFNKNVRLIDNKTNKPYPLYRNLSDLVTIKNKENGEVIDAINRFTMYRYNEFEVTLGKNLSDREYCIIFDDARIEDFNEKKLYDDIVFKVSSEIITVTNVDELETALSKNVKKVIVKNDISVNKDITVLENTELYIEENATFNLNNNILNLEGVISGNKNGIKNAKKINLSKGGVYFEPKIEENETKDGNMIEVSDVAYENISKIYYLGATFEKNDNGDFVQNMTSSNGIVGMEVKIKENDRIGFIPSFSEPVENYNITVSYGIGSNRKHKEYKVKNRVKLIVNKEEINYSLKELTNIRNSVKEGLKDGEYELGTIEKIDALINEAKSVIESDKVGQSEIDELVKKIHYFINTTLKELKNPMTVSNTNELKMYLEKYEKVALRDNINLTEDILIPSNCKLIIPSKYTLNTNNHRITVRGILIDEGKVSSKRGNIFIEDEGMICKDKNYSMDGDIIQKTRIEDKISIAISHLGKNSIENISIYKKVNDEKYKITDYVIRDNEIINTTNYSVAGKVLSDQEIKISESVENTYGSNPIYLKMEEEGFEYMKNFIVKVNTIYNTSYEKELTNEQATADKRRLKDIYDMGKKLSDYVSENKIVLNENEYEEIDNTVLMNKFKEILLEVEGVISDDSAEQENVDRLENELRDIYYNVERRIKVDYENTTTIEELEQAINRFEFHSTVKCNIKNDISMNKELTIPKYMEINIESGKTLNTNNNKLKLNGALIGKGSVDNINNILLGDSGLLFEVITDITEVDGNTAVSLKNIGKDSIRLWIDGVQFGKYDGDESYTTSSYNIKGIVVDEKVVNDKEVVLIFKAEEYIESPELKIVYRYGSENKTIILPSIKSYK